MPVKKSSKVREGGEGRDLRFFTPPRAESEHPSLSLTLYPAPADPNPQPVAPRRSSRVSIPVIKNEPNKEYVALTTKAPLQTKQNETPQRQRVPTPSAKYEPVAAATPHSHRAHPAPKLAQGGVRVGGVWV